MSGSLPTDGEPGTSPATSGASGYPQDQLFEEIAFIAYHFNWSHEEILAMPHWERQRWCAEISRINERINEGEG